LFIGLDSIVVFKYFAVGQRWPTRGTRVRNVYHILGYWNYRRTSMELLLYALFVECFR